MTPPPSLQHIILTTENDVPIMQIRDDTPLHDAAVAPEIEVELNAILEQCGNSAHYIVSFHGHECMPPVVYTKFVKFWSQIRMHEGSVAICNMSEAIRKMFLQNFRGTMATIRFYGPLEEAIGEQLQRTKRDATRA